MIILKRSFSFIWLTRRNGTNALFASKSGVRRFIGLRFMGALHDVSNKKPEKITRFSNATGGKTVYRTIGRQRRLNGLRSRCACELFILTGS